MARQHSFLELAQEDLNQLLKLQCAGNISARKMKRVQVLLNLHNKKLPKDIAKMLHMSFAAVYDIKNRYLQNGLSSIDDKPRPCHHRRKINELEEALITSIACSEPEDGNSTWTLRLIGEKFVELSSFESISPETIRTVLKKANSNHGQRSHGAWVK